MLNRTEAPLLGLPERIQVQPPLTENLPGNIPFLSVQGGTQEVIRIELIFAAGHIHSFPPLLASAANDLLDEGTKHFSSAELAEKLDLYGAFFESECGADWASVTLYTLSKFLKETLPLLQEIISGPEYPMHELKTYTVQGKQRLLVSMEKVDYLARRNFISALFGENNSYGYLPLPADYDMLETGSLKDFFAQHYANGLFGVVLSGKFTSGEADLIRETILSSKLKAQGSNPVLGAFPQDGKKIRVTKEGAIQSAIRIGRKLFNRRHPDFFRFTVLNTVLGGYFGSRLMSNIREDKGYTYGIGSGLVSQKDHGYFFISTEVGSDVCTPAIGEIYSELKRLRDDLIPEEELDLVRNYLWGSFQRSIDGPFALADRHKTLLLAGLGQDYYERYLQVLKTVSPEELREVARTWLQEGDLTEVIVGP